MKYSWYALLALVAFVIGWGMAECCKMVMAILHHPFLLLIAGATMSIVVVWKFVFPLVDQVVE